MKKLLIIILLLLNSITAMSQSLDQQAGDFLRESNKLYVVITVLVTIFAALIIFLILQERRISRIEKQLKDKNS